MVVPRTWSLRHRVRRLLAQPVPAAVLLAFVLHLLWVVLLASGGGDLAAQDAWAEFARVHPGSAYDLAWYGGVHPVSYSVASPYVMALLGVRTTMIVAGTVSAGLLALLLQRCGALARPLWPALYGAAALSLNAVSGRVTFGLGGMVALAALVVVTGPTGDGARPGRPGRRRLAAVVALTALATACSPVAGLFLGVVAAALWLQRSRAMAYAIGVPPVAVVGLCAWLFPFSGEQPMAWTSAVAPLLVSLAVFLLTPPAWRTVRLGAALYALGVVAAWLVPSEVGTNVSRLGLIYGGVVLVALLVRRGRPPLARPTWSRVGPAARARVRTVTRARTPASVGLAAAVVLATGWQVGVAAGDVAHARTTTTFAADVAPLVHQLDQRGAGVGRVEVVPMASHLEASVLPPYVNLARGWNRQADAERNPIFYLDGLLDATSYRAWLDRWSVRFVVLPRATPDPAAGAAEAVLVAGGLPYLRQVWSDTSWRLYAVEAPVPLAAAPAVVTRFDSTEVVLHVPRPGPVLVRIQASPWLSLLDASGHVLEAPEAPEGTPGGTPPVNLHGCLVAQIQPAPAGQEPDTWTLLVAPHAGTYRIAAPYHLPRGTACPDDLGPR